MHIEFIARKVTLTDSIRQFTEKKIHKVEKYFNDILDIRVEIEQERHRHVVDVFINGKDFNINAKGHNKEVTGAIQDAIEKLEIQARRAKARLKNHKRPSSESRFEQNWQVDVIEPESARAGTPQIVEQSTIAIKPMSIDEAVLQLEESSDHFFVFRNSSSDRVNVLYRRSDENLGLITPEP